MSDCNCVTNHTPSTVSVEIHHIHPQYAGGPDHIDNLEPLCPTSHSMVHKYIRLLDQYDEQIPWEIRRLFNSNIRALAIQGWNAMKEAGYTGRHY